MELSRKEQMTAWLKTSVELYAELFQQQTTAKQEREGVVLRLPPDTVEHLLKEGVVYEKDGGVFFPYSKDLQVPVIQTET